MRWLNFGGLVLGTLGVVLIFIWGPPQPTFQEYVALTTDPGAHLLDGTPVADIAAKAKAEKQLYATMSRIGLGFIFAGFLLQAFANWPTRIQSGTRPAGEEVGVPQNVTSIYATIRDGLGVAASIFAVQKPHLERYIPGISQFHNGTINLLLGQPLRVVNPDIRTSPIQWASPPYAPEVFSFQAIDFEYPIGGPRHSAWIFIPHSSPHFNDLFGIEIIAIEIPGVKTAARCCIHIPKPHRLESVVVV